MVGVSSWTGLYEGFWSCDVMAGRSEIIGDVGARVQEFKNWECKSGLVTSWRLLSIEMDWNGVQWSAMDYHGW